MIEALIAFVLLSIILIPVISVLIAGNREIQMTVEELGAHHAGIELMEQLMTIPVRFLPVGIFEDTMIADNRQIAPGCAFRFHVSPVAGIKRKVKISETDNNLKLKVKTVEVFISLIENPSKVANREICFQSFLVNEN